MSKKPWSILAEIAGDSSKNFKISVLSREVKAGNEEFLLGLRWALDGLLTFGVKKVPVRNAPPGAGVSFETFIDLVYKLNQRTLTGNAAADAIESLMNKCSDEQWNGWYRLILIKDLKAGFSESSVNKAAKGTKYEIPETPYMRCTLHAKSNIEKWKSFDGVFSQVKADGMFANINISSAGDVWITSRNGQIFPELGLEAEIQKYLKHNTQTHGELLVKDKFGKVLPRAEGNGMLNKILKGGELPEGHKVSVEVWDQIPLEFAVPKGEYGVGYQKRFNDLLSQLGAAPNIKAIATCVVGSMAEALSHYRVCRRQGLEGTVIKHPDAIWKDGTSKDQIKMKEQVTVELEVIGFRPGNAEGKRADKFGSLECASACGKLVCGVSGMSDELLDEIDNDREGWLGAIVAVESNAISSSKKSDVYSLFLPQLVERRYDKTEADTFEKIKEQFDAAVSSED